MGWDVALAWTGLVGKVIMPLHHHCHGEGGEQGAAYRRSWMLRCCVLNRTAARDGAVAAWASRCLDWGLVGRRGRGPQEGDRGEGGNMGAGLIWGAHFDSGVV